MLVAYIKYMLPPAGWNQLIHSERARSETKADKTLVARGL